MPFCCNCSCLQKSTDLALLPQDIYPIHTLMLLKTCNSFSLHILVNTNGSVMLKTSGLVIACCYSNLCRFVKNTLLGNQNILIKYMKITLINTLSILIMIWREYFSLGDDYWMLNRGIINGNTCICRIWLINAQNDHDTILYCWWEIT